MRLDTKRGRTALPPRPAPYYFKIGAGKYVGLRKTPDGSVAWCARFRDDDGKQHYDTLGPVEDAFDYDSAVTAALAWFKQLDQGVTGKTEAGAVVTVATACREYVEDRRRQKGASCANYAASFFERRVYGRPKASRRSKVEADPLARIPLAKLRKRHLEDWRDRMVVAKLDKATINREMTHLKAALNLAVSNRLVSSTQQREWTDVKPFDKAGRRRKLYLDRDQRRSLLANCQGGLRDLVEAAMLTGARAGELTSARVAHFDARQQSITLTGKTGTRTVPVSPSAVQLFKRLSRSKLPTAYLLTRDDGQPWGHSDWDDVIRAAAAKAGCPAGTVLYTLRHSFITQALLSGMPTLEVAKLVGTSLKMIEQHYGHLVMEAALERLAKVEIV